MKTLALLLALAEGALPAEAPAAWLEKPLASWNKAGAALPPAPQGAREARCEEARRPAASREDRAVAAAGWSLVGPAQVFGKTRVFLATAAYDGMCRPDGFQAFVFSDGRFAGTLAPATMRARSDGSLSLLRLNSADGVSGEFARYRGQDPLCCPSLVSSVRYRVDQTPEGPLVVPVEAATAAR